MNLGFALTRHCNLRCPHCIRDDVTDVQSLNPDLLASVLDQALDLFDELEVSFTGGEPLIHPDFGRVVEEVGIRDIPYRFVTNGWHLKRKVPALRAYPPERVHLSLSGATRETHDRERGRGSWVRLLQALAILTSREIPVVLSMVVDRRTRGQLPQAAELAESLGVRSMQYILPQPVPASAARDSDLPPGEWLPVRREIEALDEASSATVPLTLAYGAPFEEEEKACRTFRLERLYIDARGRVCSCCQLSQYGENDAEVVADLEEVSLAAAYDRYVERLQEQWTATRPAPDSDGSLSRFPCLRCAGAYGMLDWLRRYPESPWSGAAELGGGKRSVAEPTDDTRALPTVSSPGEPPIVTTPAGGN